MIKASVSKCTGKDTVTVDALYGSATSGNGKPQKAAQRGVTWHRLHLKVPGIFSGGGDDWCEFGEMTRAHLVRGHFATFTEDAPAFGKPWGIGRFWIPPHIRGDESKGIVEKEYVLETA